MKRAVFSARQFIFEIMNHCDYFFFFIFIWYILIFMSDGIFLSILIVLLYIF